MWYYALDGEQHGPVEKNEIQRMVEEGILDGEDLVWTSGMDEWSEISTVEDVHPGPPSLPDEQTNLSSSYPPNEMQDRHTGTPGSDPGTYEPFSSPTDDSSAPLETSSESGGNPAGAERVSDVTYAGFGRRLIAYIIDGLILFAFFMVLGAFVLASGGTSQDPPEGVLNFFGFLGVWMYFALKESTDKQATWGKQLMNLKVTDMNGNKIGFGKASGRHFGKILSGMILFIGYIMAAFTEKKQALHDKMAGCLVVKDE